METKYLKINPADNVVVAISDLKAGEAITVDGHAITLKEDVPAGHKVTLKDFAQGENIIKYGYPIGHAVTAVEQGRWINETQIKTNLAGLLDYTYNPVSVDLNIPKKDLTFKGYRRKNGDVGIRNEVWITKILAHAPYTLNLCSADEKIREFAKNTMLDDMKRMEYLPRKYV